VDNLFALFTGKIVKLTKINRKKKEVSKGNKIKRSDFKNEKRLLPKNYFSLKEGRWKLWQM